MENTQVIPDIVVNLNTATQVNSDDLKEITYHELAHSVHYNQVGGAYWLDNILYVGLNVVNNNNPPYGTGTTVGSGRCNIIEMWGFQMGMAMAHARYGTSHSNGATLGPWQARLEAATFIDGFIAFGWQNDIQDINGAFPENPAVTDMISGFTQATIFSTMTPTMLNGNQQRLLLQTMRPPTAPLPAYLTLATNYGL